MCNSKEEGNQQDLKEYQRDYEILELEVGAPFSEVKGAYLHLKKLYTGESPVLSPFIGEISEDDRQLLVNQIEDAFNRLKIYFASTQVEKQKTTQDQVMSKKIPEFEVYSGNALKLTREVLGVELQDISLASGIPVKHLKNIELERFNLLPPEGYIRIYVTKYAEYLSLDANRVVTEYMKGYQNRSRRNSNQF